MSRNRKSPRLAATRRGALFLLFTIITTKITTASPVTITEKGQDFILSNNTLTARIDKHSGTLFSLTFNGTETLAGIAYWSHSAASPQTVDSITIDPTKNNGQRGEVSIKGNCQGKPVGGGPGGSAIADIEIRYTLAAGDSGIYTYSIWTHKPDYPATSVGEARFCAKLNDSVFDWMTVDPNRNMKMITTYDWDHGIPMNMKEARLMTTGQYKGQVEHKYDYSANQFQDLVWGWSSTTKHIGLWFINPTIEYLSGGPTKVELSAHRDATFTDSQTAPAPPCLLNYWRGSHYGGSSLVVAQGEQWTKVIGPFLIYCNSGSDPQSIYKNALARSPVETAAWPYSWVNGVDYPHKDQRSTVTGQLILNDPQATTNKLPNLLVGLTAPDYTTSGGRGGPSTVDWQNDAKHYEFWTRGTDDGKFSIPNVRPGSYTLHAIADGVLGEFAQTKITIPPGKNIDLAQLQWTPLRHGKQIWDIGIPNRTASEFFKGDDYFHWGWYLQYPKLFPNDVNYTVGQSDFHKDWFFEQVPHEIGNDTTGKSNGRETTWTIHFNLPTQLTGKAILRLAIVGIGARHLDIAVNNKPAGTLNNLTYNATINRDGIGGYWTEKDVTFDASLTHPGPNTLSLTVPAGGLTNGIEYDYLRLEQFDH
jgi:rhamnogalacturonan endolyase